MKKIIDSTLIILALSFLASCSSKDLKDKASSETPILVSTSNVSGANGMGIIEASGLVEAAHSVNISTRAMGYITRFDLKVGDRVKAGQMLFTVNSNDINAKKAQTEAMIDQADAALKSAQKDLERFTVLYKQQSASAKELDQITLQYQSAKANAMAARAMKNEVAAHLAYTTVTAPFSGTITQKMAEAGSMASPGMPVLTIEQAGNLQVSASVSENQIGALNIGDAAEMNIESINKTITGKIIQINPSAQFSGGQYIVKISLPLSDNKLYAGMFVHVQFPQAKKVASSETGVNMIPVKAIVYKDQLTGVYTISAQQTALLRWVRLGAKKGDQVEVLSGLSNQEQFILSAEGRLYNGAPVKTK